MLVNIEQVDAISNGPHGALRFVVDASELRLAVGAKIPTIIELKLQNDDVHKLFFRKGDAMGTAHYSAEYSMIELMVFND